MIAVIENPMKRWLERWHGQPVDAKRQYMFYRCELCRGVVTWKQIAKGGCRCGVGSRIRAAHLTMREKVRLLLAPWSL